MKMQISRRDELICLKAAISFIENGDETLDTPRRYNTNITFYERVGELAETIASEWVVARYLGIEYDRKNDIAIFVTGQTPHYYIAGWIPVAIAQKTRFRHSHQPTWWVSQINLQPIENLRKSIHGHSAV